MINRISILKKVNRNHFIYKANKLLEKKREQVNLRNIKKRKKKKVKYI